MTNYNFLLTEQEFTHFNKAWNKMPCSSDLYAYVIEKGASGCMGFHKVTIKSAFDLPAILFELGRIIQREISTFK